MIGAERVAEDRPVADILRRIVARRRERIAELHAQSAVAGPADPRSPLPQPGNTAALGPSLLEAEGAFETRPHRTRPRADSAPTADRPPGSRSLGGAPDAAGAGVKPVLRTTPTVLPAKPAAAANPFLSALAARRGHAIIAEIKMGSPRLGSLADRLDPIAQARAYAAAGAAALSVVVEPDFFFGSYRLLAECRAASGLPAIAKDFVVDPIQLAWARQAGADAVLLIAALHSAAELADYAQAARALGLVPLIETHDAADLERLFSAGSVDSPWELVGVNNRDLRTFAVDLENSIAMAPQLPAGALKVAESAIRSRADIAKLRDAGFDAFLIGESLLLAADPAAQLRELLGDA